MDAHRMTKVEDVSRFITAGKAYFTLRSAKTGTRFTYRSRGSEDGKVSFLGVMASSSNEGHYDYIGVLRKDHTGDTTLQLTLKSKRELSDVEVVAIDYLLTAIHRGALPGNLEFWHEGRCACCGRRLTVPESIENGIGPECIKRFKGG